MNRRNFVRTAAVLTAAARMGPALLAAEEKPERADPVPAGAAKVSAEPPRVAQRSVAREGTADLTWLEGRPAAARVGTTFGVPWPRGKFPATTRFTARTAQGEPVPTQTWPLATWPDGSLKWTAHAIPPDAAGETSYTVAPGDSVLPSTPLRASDAGATIEIDTGVIRCRIAKRGDTLISSISRGGRELLRDGRLVCVTQSTPDLAAEGPVERHEFIGAVEAVTLEQAGPVRAVVKIEGRHSAAGRAWLPFTVRLYFYAGSDAVRALHTFIFDGDEQKDFIAGLGLKFSVPLSDPLYDRHVRFGGQADGLWAEAVQGITGLRRDPGEAVRQAQIEGKACPPTSTWTQHVATELHDVPAWGDVSLTQLSADGFEIRKRTKPGFGWIGAGAGQRANGLGYLGGASGGVAFGLRNFWQSHPAQIDVRGATGAAAEVTMWLWSPEAAPMDLRFYHDGMGQDTYAKQKVGLDITYEDYEPGFGTPHGVARTSELMLWALDATPPRPRFGELAATLQNPPLLVCPPEHYAAIGLFGGIWGLPDRSQPAKARIEDQLDFYFDYYRRQIEQHHWYGFWNYGDFRHTYDYDRHVWRYDVGGFAWDNSELSPDLWLWYSFLRSGRADIFRVAEAMTRHTGEVDVYHLGRFRGLGSRHNVQHWGDSAKQVRISTVAYRRFYYYLTADERVGDLMHELIDCDERVADISPGRKLGHPDTRYPANISFGTDWCSFAAAWLTEWERTGNPKWRDKIAVGLKSIGTMPNGWFNAGGGYDPATGRLFPHNDRATASHLNAVFGAVEISAELLQLIDAPEYKRAWLQYCEVYNADPAEQERLMGEHFPNGTLRQGHSRLTAYAARQKHDPALAARAWREFRMGEPGREESRRLVHLTGPAVLTPIDEAAHVSTNGTAQFGLAAIECLALVGDALAP